MKRLLTLPFLCAVLFLHIGLIQGDDSFTFSADKVGASAYSASCQMDLDNDGDVDGIDLHLFAEDFDYVFDQDDVAVFYENYGKIFCRPLVNAVRNPGSILVYPLIDNIDFTTIVDITNRGKEDVWLQCYMVVHPIGQPYSFEITGFFIHLTHSEPFFWETSKPYSRTDEDGVLTQIEAFNQKKGYFFCFAVENPQTALEINWNYLIGSSRLHNNKQAWQYSAIPHQAIKINPDRILQLNAIEYTMATSQIMFQGFAQGFAQGLGGKLTVCNLSNNSEKDFQPNIDVNLECWNQNEVPGGRHLNFFRFGQYDLGTDLYLRLEDVFTPKFQCASTSSAPIWAVFYQFADDLSWGGNVWQHPLTGRPATVILAPLPFSKLAESPDHN